MAATKIGLLGAGVISGIYLENITKMFRELEVAAVYDLYEEKAKQAAEKYGIPKVCGSMEELLGEEDISIVLNLTRPYEHYAVSEAALMAGKHVYTEKPLGITLEEGEKLTALAREKGLYICGAPDTFLGAGIQTCRKLIEDGFIGDIIGASAFMVCRGHESWHASPEFYYKAGGGPMMDMGPYYLTALVNLAGSVESVSGMVKTSFPTRTITSEPQYGQTITVDVPTHVTGMMRFENGAIGTIITTFDVHRAEVPRIEIYGTNGTLSVPDPNTFGGPVRLYRPGEEGFREIPLLFQYEQNSRGLGLADMAKAIETGRAPRANGSLLLHVLEVMAAFETSSSQRREIAVSSRYQLQPGMLYEETMGILK